MGEQELAGVDKVVAAFLAEEVPEATEASAPKMPPRLSNENLVTLYMHLSTDLSKAPDKQKIDGLVRLLQIRYKIKPGVTPDPEIITLPPFVRRGSGITLTKKEFAMLYDKSPLEGVCMVAVRGIQIQPGFKSGTHMIAENRGGVTYFFTHPRSPQPLNRIQREYINEKVNGKYRR
ncbi:MAG: hypothetical protein V1702_03235 [Candidatus Woesearchaeota archaeon]